MASKPTISPFWDHDDPWWFKGLLTLAFIDFAFVGLEACSELGLRMLA